MPQYYGGQGPAQYAQGQQSRQDQQMQNLLRMMMMMKQHKQRQGQWEQERATQQEQWQREQQRKEESTEAYIRQVEEAAKKKPKPTLTDLRTRTAEKMVTTGEWTPDEGRKYTEQGKEPVRLPKNVDKAFASHMQGKYGDDWKNTVEAVQYYEEWDEWLMSQRKTGSSKDSLGEIRRYWSRDRNSIRQRYIAAIASADPDQVESARKSMADALLASEKAEQEEIDIYKGIKRKKPEIPPPPELPQGAPGWKESNVPMFSEGGFTQPQQSGLTATMQGNNVIINGKPYPLNEDGTVTVNGKTFRIE